MAEVVSASVQFPTVVFTVAAVVIVLLWVLSLLGVVDPAGEAGEGLFEPLGLANAPVTVVFSVLALVGWLASVLAQIFLLDRLSGAALALASFAAGLAAVAIGAWVASKVARPLGRALVTATAPSGRDLVGRPAEIRSGTVSATSGYADATWPDGGMSRVDVRLAEPGDITAGELVSGDRVLLVDWDPSANTYVVSRLPDDLT